MTENRLVPIINNGRVSDFDARVERATKEIREVLMRERLSIKPTIAYTQEGIIPQVEFAELKGK